MSNKTMSMNRRDFLGLGAAGAAVVGALGLAGCAPSAPAEKSLGETGAATDAAAASDWLGTEPEVAEGDIAETLDTDFLIIGAGTAGLAAAGAAADLGLNFIICDKANQVPETREYLGGVDTAYAKANNVEINKPKLLNELTRYASGKCNQKLIKMWIDESAEYVDWVTEVMKDQGKEVMLDMPPAHATGGTDYYVPYVQHLWEPSYVPPTRNDVIAERLSGQGHDILFEHEMVKLLHGEGTVTGAIFKTKDGYKQINAKNTLLATGGYAANPVMMRALQPAAVACCTASSFNPTCTGDGIRAGLWAGASKDIDAAPMIFDRGAVAPGVDAGYEGTDEAAVFRGNIFQENIGSQPFMKVNRRGQRFANESTPYDFVCFAATYQPGGVWCQVYDANMMDDMVRFETVGCSRVVPYIEMGMTFDEYTAASQESGILMKADTLEELADMLGFANQDKENFLAEVERYNGFFDKQVDEDFGKEAYRLSAIRQAPFYGCWFGGSLLTTIDGLRINENCQVLDPELNVIEGLYAAGDVSGSFFSGNYPEYIVGVASGRSSVEGRHVAKLLGGAA